MLTKEEKGKTMNMRCPNRSTDEIACTLNRSKKVLWTFLQAPERYEKAKRSGRPSKMSAPGKRISLREAHRKSLQGRYVKSRDYLFQKTCTTNHA